MSLPIEKTRSSDRLMAVIVCATVLLIGTAVSLPVPMYAEYARVSGAGSKALGIAFACYAFGVLPSLLFLGGVSDRTGGGCRLLSPCVLVSPLLRPCQSFRACRHWPWRGSHKAWLLASPVRPQQPCCLRAFRTHWHPSELLPA